MALLIVHKPGHAPRVGHTIGDEAASVAEWQKANPDAAIYVLDAATLPTPGTAWVSTADEYLAMRADPSDDELSSI
jgi:hypothetical protein